MYPFCYHFPPTASQTPPSPFRSHGRCLNYKVAVQDTRVIWLRCLAKATQLRVIGRRVDNRRGEHCESASSVAPPPSGARKRTASAIGRCGCRNVRATRVARTDAHATTRCEVARRRIGRLPRSAASRVSCRWRSASWRADRARAANAPCKMVGTQCTAAKRRSRMLKNRSESETREMPRKQRSGEATLCPTRAYMLLIVPVYYLALCRFLSFKHLPPPYYRSPRFRCHLMS